MSPESSPTTAESPPSPTPAAIPAGMPTPHRSPVTAGLQAILDFVAPDVTGEVADYIPDLAEADPDRFGIALCSMAGHRYGVGDCDVEFTIQSISKAFVYALAISDLGVDAVLDRVGVEATGDAFNAIKLEQGTGRPPNPMVNAGALLTTSLIRASYPEERLERILQQLSAFAGRPLAVDESVAAGELATASRNRALGYLMQSLGALTDDVEEVLWAYCHQCAISITASDLAVMSATLANGGVNPVTGRMVVSEDVAVRTLSVMATCGMYDFSGEWLLRVGLPAKSGVAGGLIAASPTEFGIGVFSPRLDARGNSVRGIQVARELSERFDLHLLHHAGETAPVIYRDERVACPTGGSIVVLGAQGVLEFGATEQLLWDIDQHIPDDLTELRGFVLDLHRVTRLDDLPAGLLKSRIADLLAQDVPVGLVQREHVYEQLPEHPALQAFAHRGEAVDWLRTR